MLCNNMCETFNSAILKARDKLVLTLIEIIRTYLMKRLVRKRAELKRKHRGRPKKARNLQTDEVRVEGKVQQRRNYIKIKCNKCNESGHNKTTCDRRKGTEATEPRQGT
ncbi:hypothetical protein QYF36_019203 [Acer negundo]|nr:hypothetical protein QYF36_019203 [Acer negundo]